MFIELSGAEAIAAAHLIITGIATGRDLIEAGVRPGSLTAAALGLAHTGFEDGVLAAARALAGFTACGGHMADATIHGTAETTFPFLA